MDNYDLAGANNIKIVLPKYLNEVSGLASIGSKQLLLHNDEQGIIYVFDLKSQKVMQKIRIGNEMIREDFEGIAVKGDTVFLSTGNGKIYSVLFKSEKKEAEIIFVEKIKTKDKINLEGLCYDKGNNILIIPNKIEVNKKHKDEREFYAFDIEKKKFSRKPLFTVSLKELKKKFDIDNFSPTAIEIHPLNNNIFILPSHEKCLVEFSQDGKMLNAIKLDEKKHRQPEGITFLQDLSMVISDEASGKRAELTIIPFGK